MQVFSYGVLIKVNVLVYFTKNRVLYLKKACRG